MSDANLFFAEMVYQWENVFIFVAGIVISVVLWCIDSKVLSKKARNLLIGIVVITSTVLSSYVGYVTKEYGYLPEVNFDSYSYAYVEQLLINKGFKIDETLLDAIAEEKVKQGEEPTSYYFKVTNMEPESGTFINKDTSIILSVTWLDYYEDISLNIGGISFNTSAPSIILDEVKFDEEQIAYIISEADALAIKEDFESALMRIQNGLMTYPESVDLQSKADEYTEVLNVKIKEKTLAEAKSLADSGNYVSAITLIKNAQATQGDNAEYQSAFKTYSSAYKIEVIASADALASNGDYVAVIATLNEAKSVVGNDVELINKGQLYEDEYVSV